MLAMVYFLTIKLGIFLANCMVATRHGVVKAVIAAAWSLQTGQVFGSFWHCVSQML